MNMFSSRKPTSCAAAKARQPPTHLARRLLFDDAVADHALTEGEGVEGRHGRLP
jgi:hypothetical protein